MGGIDNNQINAGIDQRLGTGKPVIPHRRGSRHPQTPLRVLGGIRMQLGFFHIFDGDKPDAAIIIINHQKFFDSVLVQETLGLFLIYGFAHGHQIFMRHQLGNLLVGIRGKPHITIGENADKATIFFRYRHTGNLVLGHQSQCFRQGRIGANGQWIDHHAAFEFFNLAHFAGLFLRRHIAVQNTQPAGLCHGDGKFAFGYRVHSGRYQRNTE